MALSEWKKLKSNVSVAETKKKFFNKYYYNVKYKCPGARIILRYNITESEIEHDVEIRKERHKVFNYAGSWRAGKELLNEISAQQLRDFLHVKTTFSDQIKIRVEEPYITIYANDESLLLQIAEYLRPHCDRLVSVCRPLNDAVKQELDCGNIVMKTDVGYLYKFVCKDGTCPNKQAVSAYIENLDTQVKVSRGVHRMLTREGNFIWGVWFYGNDPNIATMLNIIEPNFVTNIHKLVVTQE